MQLLMGENIGKIGERLLGFWHTANAVLLTLLELTAGSVPEVVHQISPPPAGSSDQIRIRFAALVHKSPADMVTCPRAAPVRVMLREYAGRSSM